ncbi:hypothetical protein BABINDRAFT_164375 [Babjeviella inositovora NRRL Y-12698]|uniref:Protein EFR3 n=1 Tax=Babjeviella inositovora NRRL Y-12698 TaxID=984486 RepID=A0A1E3QYD4_9ASCO|nr:uncharacterized protein BABINDRAFT_164375 [Babjeviella inositovora NRRL Y-12698]ODQ82604.1 hypothetical protein BABINDRAFT_164375 [Babjeviella inositovora NRRL Y-12698]
MHFFKSKHQKLILQCYPPGKDTDKKPNALELSYLLYYATTRRVKLEKVGRYLEKKTLHDIARGHAGNAQVSLNIIATLIDKCADNLSVFALNVTVVLRAVCGANDVALCARAVPVFGEFCEKLDEDMLSGDRAFVSNFEQLAAAFLGLGSRSGPQQAEWQALSLDAARCLAGSAFVARRYAAKTVDTAIHLVLEELARTHSDDALARLQSRADVDGHARRQSVRSIPTMEAVPEDKSLAALKGYFNTTSATQLQNCTRAVCSYIVTRPTSAHWNDAVVEIATNWVPVQMRFIVLGTLMSELKGPGETVVANAIAGLLASEVNMVGLAVTDTLRKILALQEKSVSEASGTPSIARDGESVRDTAAPATTLFSNIISSLATHTYYHNQTSDMVAEILARCRELCTDKPATPFLHVLFDDARRIFQTPNHGECSIDAWEDSFEILTIAGSSQVKLAYLDCMKLFLESDVGNRAELVRPNYNNYITGEKKSVAHFFYIVHSLLATEEPHVLQSVAEVVYLLIGKYGINTIANGIPFFFEWQFTSVPASPLKRDVTRDSFAYCFLYHATAYLELDLLLDVTAKVAARTTQGIWEALDVRIPAVHGAAPDVVFSYSRAELRDYFIQDMAASWIDTDRVINPSLHGIHDTDLASNTTLSAPEITFSSAPQTIDAGTLSYVDPESRSVRSHAMSQGSSYFSAARASPRVADLRRAVSGAMLQPNHAGESRVQSLRASNMSIQTKELVSLLDDLEVEVQLDSRGRIEIPGKS